MASNEGGDVGAGASELMSRCPNFGRHHALARLLFPATRPQVVKLFDWRWDAAGMGLAGGFVGIRNFAGHPIVMQKL